MLIFFIHGVATRKIKFAEACKDLIKGYLIKKGKPLPLFDIGFFADVLNDKGKIWNAIYADLQAIK